jgi:ABC-2 type transport system permease protein
MRFSSFAYVAQKDSKIFYDLLGSAELNETEKETTITESSTNLLNYETSTKVDPLRYFIAVIYAALLFGFIAIVNIFIKEKENFVLNRISISPARPLTYIGTKLSLGIMALIIQTIIIMLSIKTLSSFSVQISVLHMGLLILGLGLVSLGISICLGIYLDGIDKVNYFAICIIVLSSMLSGLYFPIELSPEWMQNLASLFPQRWLIYAADQLIAGNTEVLYLYFMLIFGFVIFLVSFAVLGYKINSKYSH